MALVGSDDFAGLAARGLKAFPIPADGNCLFRAFCDQMHGSQEQHLEVRKAVVEHIRKHPNVYRSFLPADGERRNPGRASRNKSTSSASLAITQQRSERAWKDYLQKMSKKGTWGDNMEVQGLANLYNVDIRIFHSSGSSNYIYPVGNPHPKPVIYLGRHTWEHFSTIRKSDGSLPSPEPIPSIEVTSPPLFTLPAPRLPAVSELPPLSDDDDIDWNPSEDGDDSKLGEDDEVSIYSISSRASSVSSLKITRRKSPFASEKPYHELNARERMDLKKVAHNARRKNLLWSH